MSSLGTSVTDKKGPYLAFLDAYTRVNGRPPAEADMQRHFRVSPPSVHHMVLTLERAGLIRRQPGLARSIEVLVDPKRLPVLSRTQPVNSSVQRNELVREELCLAGYGGGLNDVGPMHLPQPVRQPRGRGCAVQPVQSLSNSPCAYSVLAYSRATSLLSVRTRPSCVTLTSSVLSRFFEVSRPRRRHTA